MSRDELVTLAYSLFFADEPEAGEIISILEQNVSDPKVIDYIFQDDLSPEDAIDKALQHKPIQL